jgi:predicted AlkP superfamily pyrophosphatase or phosphodiesterase
MHRSLVACLSLVVCALVVAGASPLPQQKATALATAQAAPRTAPKLVVILVVDQFRADYVARFSAQWTGGLRRMLDDGASFPQAAFAYMATVTCVGHSSIATGSLPRTHGIIGNDIWDRSIGKSGNCVADPDTRLVTYGGDPIKATGTSTRKLLVPTLADELRAQLTTTPRVVTMSLKDYTATSMAGRRADAAVWVNLTARTLVSSSAFGQAPVPWVADFLKANPITGDFGKTWTKLQPEAAYQFKDDAEGERAPGKWTRTFPHVLKGGSETPDGSYYAEWEESPFSDRFLGKLAATAVDAMKLGQGPGTDYLAVSFSALDLVGHDFGPRSHEVQDLLAQLDRTLGTLLSHLDGTVGRGNYVLALTGDHGVSPVPEQMAALGLTGGRVLIPDLTSRIEKALEPFLGPGKKVTRMVYNDLFFEPGVYDKMRANLDAMRATLEAVRSMPGIARVFTYDQLAAMAGAPADELARAAVGSFHPSRSGDFIVVPQPYHQFASGASRTSGTTHGSPYWYDRRVPLILLGKGIKRGTYTTEAAPTDIAPTLAFLCGVTLPAADGRILNEALTDTGRTLR